MIAQLTGTLLLKEGTELIVSCGGVGYAVSVPLSTTDNVCKVGENVTLLTILSVREDAMQLFGFATASEREMFKLLTSIQGIGPRTAIGILSSATVSSLSASITVGDPAMLQRLPGIGKKTAERVIVELREKVGRIQGGATTAGGGLSKVDTASYDAMSALQALGYTRLAAEKALSNVLSTETDKALSSEELIRKALKFASA